eukprot:750858-Hanusia_phi.AAC.1
MFKLLSRREEEGNGGSKRGQDKSGQQLEGRKRKEREEDHFSFWFQFASLFRHARLSCWRPDPPPRLLASSLLLLLVSTACVCEEGPCLQPRLWFEQRRTGLGDVTLRSYDAVAHSDGRRVRSELALLLAGVCRHEQWRRLTSMQPSLSPSPPPPFLSPSSSLPPPRLSSPPLLLPSYPPLLLSLRL